MEGAIPVTLDELAWGEHLIITGELLLPVESRCWSGRARSRHHQAVISHPAAITQCRNFLTRQLPDAVVVAAASTRVGAGCVRPRLAVRRGDRGGDPGEHYGLVEIASRIVTGRHLTRFIRVGPPVALPEPREPTAPRWSPS